MKPASADRHRPGVERRPGVEQAAAEAGGVAGEAAVSRLTLAVLKAYVGEAAAEAEDAEVGGVASEAADA